MNIEPVHLVYGYFGATALAAVCTWSYWLWLIFGDRSASTKEAVKAFAVSLVLIPLVVLVLYSVLLVVVSLGVVLGDFAIDVLTGVE